ncbi:MAG: PAS domain S-box protein [Bacteroidales bacterium]|nr:PAS domain S-box protein [Bacteroidales bacterium]
MKAKPTYKDLESELSKLKKQIEHLKLSRSSSSIHESSPKVVISDDDDVLFDRETATEKNLKAITEELAESEKKYQVLIENINDVIWVFNATQNKYTYMSPSVFRMGGYTPEEVEKHGIDELFTPDSAKKVKKVIHNTAQEFAANPTQKHQTTHEYQQIKKDGSYHWVEIMTELRFGKNGDIEIFGVSRNIEKRKKVELALKENEAKLRESNKTKDKFFSIIAHDLRSPFNAILGFSNLLLKNHGKYDEQNREKLIKPIESSASETLKLLDNLLDWATAQTNKIEFIPKQNSLKNIFSDIILQTELIAKQKGISLSYQLDNEIAIYADEYMLNSILRNLISNAIKFTEKNGKIELKADENYKNIIISVSDTGIGINQKSQEKIFDISEKTTTKGTENEKGTGLGLILCKEFIEKHGGEIWMESKENIGSTFSFSIPKRQMTNN